GDGAWCSITRKMPSAFRPEASSRDRRLPLTRCIMKPVLRHDPRSTPGAAATGEACDIASEASELRRWLFQDALALWWDVGADHVHGGFHEAIDLDGRPAPRPRRARSIARMAFAYCEAGRLGWSGPWRAAAQHALDYFCRHFVTDDGTTVSAVDPE